MWHMYHSLISDTNPSVVWKMTLLKDRVIAGKGHLLLPSEGGIISEIDLHCFLSLVCEKMED